MAEILASAPEFERLASEILVGGNTLRFRAQGGSMAPFIRDGDILEVEPLGARSVRNGDVLLCRVEAGRLFAHRASHVVRRAGQIWFRLQGDHRFTPDGCFSQDQALGFVVAVERAGKRWRIDSMRWRYAALLWIATWRLYQGLVRQDRPIGRLLRDLKGRFG